MSKTILAILAIITAGCASDPVKRYGGGRLKDGPTPLTITKTSVGFFIGQIDPACGIQVSEDLQGWRDTMWGVNVAWMEGFTNSTTLARQPFTNQVDRAFFRQRPRLHDVTLAWDKSPDTDIAGYGVYVSNAAGVYRYHVDIGNDSIAKVTGLFGGMPYFFVVDAYDGTGLRSDPSNEVMYTPPP